MEQTLDIMKRTLTVMQIFAISQFGCGGREFRKNLLKRTTKGNHWGYAKFQSMTIRRAHLFMDFQLWHLLLF